MNMYKNGQELRKYKEGLTLTSEQRDIIIGLMLGDGHLETQNNGRTYRLVLEQTRKKEDYINHLYKVFEPWVLTPPKIKMRNTGEHLFFRTISHPAFRFYGLLFYKEKQKIIPKNMQHIPKNMHKYFTDRVLAYWYMDDGSKKGANRSGKVLHTEGFSEAEVHELCNALNIYGVETKVHKKTRKRFSRARVESPDNGLTPTYEYILYITAVGDRVFTEKIRPYVLPYFAYKL